MQTLCDCTADEALIDQSQRKLRNLPARFHGLPSLDPECAAIAQEVPRLGDQGPFANLPEAKSGRWGAGLTAAKMKDGVWLTRSGSADGLFEWTAENHLRHTKFIALREDKPAQQLKRD